jgi:DNA-binding transcriptional ArsR family regulator
MCDYGILKSHIMNRSKEVSVAARMRQRIQEAPEETIFIVRDFLDLGSRRAVDESLRRLTREGLVRRLQQGVYDRPRISRLLGEPVPPAPEALASALARRNGARVAPSLAASANALGISTQVPAKSVFRTNGGKARRVKVGNQTIELRPAAPGQFPDSEAGAVIQALRFLGEGNVTEAIIERLRRELTDKQKEALRQEWMTAPGWMHPILQEVSE